MFQSDTTNPQPSTPVFVRPSSRRTTSFSSFSSFSSTSSLCSFDDYNNNNHSTPATPLRFSSTGIPFSWEQHPGIPKQKLPDNDHSFQSLLPLPPPAGNSMKEFSPRKSAAGSFRKDPFFTALVECSKDDDRDHKDWKLGTKVVRSLSDRIAFINVYTSCKRTCSVSESTTVRLPKTNGL